MGGEAFNQVASSANSNRMIMEEIVNAILAVALAAWPITGAVAFADSPITYYQAKAPSFGCSSVEATHQLEKVRSDEKAFQAALMDKQLIGECVSIVPGTQVDGSIESADDSRLRVNEKIDPPGYEAPLADFQTKVTDEK
jgi:hypothetical protein